MTERPKKPSPQDRLGAYIAKRDFKTTPEPKTGALEPGHRFVVQHHWARRDHYDFRLEMNGVLVSWAVTRGPSLDPADKRLAVRTEDHPLSYADFEGLIPQGAYGGGTVMVWDRGTWEPLVEDANEALEKGSLKFRLHGERMRGRWALVRMKPEGKRENWLLIKEKDELAEAGQPFVERFETSVATGRTRQDIESGAASKKAVKAKKRQETAPFPDFIPPLLCETSNSIPAGSDWLYEIKYDGYRLQAACAGDSVCLYTREGLNWTARFATVAESLRRLDLPPCLIDGEAVVFDERGLSDFPKLVAALEGGRPTAFVAFDLLHLNGRDLTKTPLTDRKRLLAETLAEADGATLRIAPWMEGDGEALFRRAVEGGAEGLICKRKSSLYRSCRSASWVKVKAEKREDVIVVGYSPSPRRAFASLLAAVEDGNGLRYVGRFGTGFSAKELDRTFERLQELTREGHPEGLSGRDKAPRGRVWVEPVLRAEIALAGWTGDGQIRQGRFLGWREDKAPQQNTKLKPKAAKSRTPLKAVQPVPKSNQAADAALLARITHGDRVIYPETSTTKEDVARYYLSVADRLLPHLANRPVSFVRAPEGLSKETFFQRHLLPGMTRGIERVPDLENGHADYLVIASVEGLATAAQFSAIEFHGWGARTPEMYAPDRMVFDLDPDEAVSFACVRDAAFLLREVLETVRLQSFPMLTGGKGIHVVVPLDATQDFDLVGDFSAGIARGLAKSDPKNFLAVASKAKRRDKIFIDWMRNRRGATAIMPWSLRARSRPTVAMPLSWSALETETRADAYLYTDALQQAGEAESWLDIRQSISKQAVAFLKHGTL